MNLKGDGAHPLLEDPDPEAQLSGRMGISDVAHAFGMTERAIRYYETKGLVRYARDRENRRVFDTPARERLRRIGMLRSVGLSITEVAELINAEPYCECVLYKLRQRRQALEGMLQHVDAVIAKIDAHPRGRV